MTTDATLTVRGATSHRTPRAAWARVQIREVP
jgi:hypothetical protein